jgi:DNA invertase Pin-like site-specific DNA recombinase
MSTSHYPERQAQHSEKILPRHLERLAVVYVRQSTMQQVLDHQESTRLQYGLVERAQALGWPEHRVLIIDDDLGKSGSSSEGRQGFQRLVAEVGLDHVGLILGIEMSRLARSNKDWHHLLELCALFGTLIADNNGVYDVRQYNDRLLLGLSGMMSEAELYLLKQRLHQGKLNKARRGELAFALPIGYVRRPSGEVVFDPDEQVQQVVKLIFQKFEELGTLHGLLRYLDKHSIELGVRVREGPGKGELQWRRPNRMTLQGLLKNPIYAGAYAYGRRQIDPRKKQPGRPCTGRVSCQEYHALIKDRFPAYISWEQFEQNLARLKANRARADEIGAVRHGPSLLAGLLICGRCGCRMQVRYGGPKKLHSYTCTRLATDYGADTCQYLPGTPLDEFVSEWLLKALEPAALALSLEAAAHLETERAELDRLWQLRLERAAFEAERAARHYRLIEPENRLVARQLAQEWEGKLALQQALKEDYQRFLQAQPHPLSAAEREAICQLAENLPALWHALTTTTADRKEIVRQVIQQVVVENEGKSERLHVTIEWLGGEQTKGLVNRPVRKLEQLSYYPELVERIRTLASEGLSPKSIAERLDQEGYRPPKQAERFGRQAVYELMRRLDLGKRRRPWSREGLSEHEWWLADLVRTLKIPDTTLHAWRQRGWVKARRDEATGRWIIWADGAEMERLKERHALPAGYYSRKLWLKSAPPEIMLSHHPPSE